MGLLPTACCCCEGCRAEECLAAQCLADRCPVNGMSCHLGLGDCGAPPGAVSSQMLSGRRPGALAYTVLLTSRREFTRLRSPESVPIRVLSGSLLFEPPHNRPKNWVNVEPMPLAQQGRSQIKPGFKPWPSALPPWAGGLPCSPAHTSLGTLG